MSGTGLRRRIGAGCFLAILAPAGAALARGSVEPRATVCLVGENVRAGAVQGARMFGAPSRARAPWFRRSFVVVGTDGTCVVKPVEIALPDARPPGIVRNFRRTDGR